MEKPDCLIGFLCFSTDNKKRGKESLGENVSKRGSKRFREGKNEAEQVFIDLTA